MLEKFDSKSQREAKTQEQIDQFKNFVAAKAAKSMDKILPSSSK